MKARDLVTRPLVTVGPHDFARHAEGLMDDLGLTMLPVVDQGFFYGVVTKAACRHGEGDAAKVERVMRQPALTVGPDFDAETLFDAMTRYEVICVPVLDQGQVIGMITRLDVLRALSHDDPRLRADHAAHRP
ncbi:HPP family protein [Lentzea sp. NEAU-D7]|uniref:CBS domain-containing protein n=1 Tax=Lentzea sp. NEAU-D7 TaxID=2994667 RepID=UPI00224B6AD1|nr:CBS domain-containing protein [Lentzea sp. NEAU-D7]MCX2951424.1 CBS domain-containing protein [Lentzea sp. NEAU-D7]